MNCPPEIADILLGILGEGLLAIRSRGRDGPASPRAVGADHLHNSPRILEAYRPELLLYYRDVERAACIERSASEPLASHQPPWQRLEPQIAAIRRQTQVP